MGSNPWKYLELTLSKQTVLFKDPKTTKIAN